MSCYSLELGKILEEKIPLPIIPLLPNQNTFFPDRNESVVFIFRCLLRGVGDGSTLMVHMCIRKVNW